jgi:hypothetical protein
MREELLGYLLDALEPDERQVLEARLQQDPELQRDLAILRRSLGCLDHDETEPEPRCGLAARTFHYVMSRVGPCSGQFAASCQWRSQDVIVAGVILVAAAMIFFPAVARSRSQARLNACQLNLSDLGQALAAYSQRHGDYFPEVPARGNLGVAGIYAATLIENGFIEPRHVVCPASEFARRGEFRIPTRAELLAAQGDELRRLQATVGGSYGYSFGYLSAGQYHGHRNLGRGNFALMADAPPPQVISSKQTILESARQTGSEVPACSTGLHSVSTNHGCCGQNVLFEDGRVQTLTTSQIDDGGAGIGPADAVIGSSGATPIVHTLLESVR